MTTRRFIPMLLIVVTLATFITVLRNEWVIPEDFESIVQNPHLNPTSPANLAFEWKNPMQGQYIPVTQTLWFLLAAIRGPDPVIFHATSLILHVMSVCIVWNILRRLLYNDVAAGVGALIFALHPMQVETIAWASGMKDLLAGMLSLVMIQKYLSFVRSQEKRREMHYAMALAAFGLAMLANPSAIVAPLMAGAIQVILLRKRVRAVLMGLAPMIVMAIPCLFGAMLMQTARTETDAEFWMRPLIAGDAVAFYLGKLFWPVGLTNDYGRTSSTVVESGVVYWAWIVPVLLGACLALSRKLLPEVWCGFIIFVVGLLPVLGFMVADHYVYMPMLGIALTAGALFAKWPRVPTYAIATAALSLLMLVTIRQIAFWRDSVALYSRAIQVNPQNITAHGMLGNALARDDQPAEAAEQFQVVVDARPTNLSARVYLARAQSGAGRTREAFENLTVADRLLPGNPTIAAELAELQRRLDSPATTQ